MNWWRSRKARQIAREIEEEEISIANSLPRIDGKREYQLNLERLLTEKLASPNTIKKLVTIYNVTYQVDAFIVDYNKRFRKEYKL